MGKSTSANIVFTSIWKSVILFLALLMNITLGYRLLAGDQSVMVWRAMKGKQGALATELAVLDQRRASLSREIRLLKTDNEYVEKVIRQRLNYVRPNEILYIFDEVEAGDLIWTGSGSDGYGD